MKKEIIAKINNLLSKGENLSIHTSYFYGKTVRYSIGRIKVCKGDDILTAYCFHKYSLVIDSININNISRWQIKSIYNYLEKKYKKQSELDYKNNKLKNVLEYLK